MRVHLTHDHEKIILKDDESFEDKMNSMDEEEDVDEKDEEL